MKVKIFYDHDDKLEILINDFIVNKVIVDIKFDSINNNSRMSKVLIIYK